MAAECARLWEKTTKGSHCVGCACWSPALSAGAYFLCQASFPGPAPATPPWLGTHLHHVGPVQAVDAVGAEHPRLHAA